MTGEWEMRIEAVKAALPKYEDAKRIEHTLGVLSECVWIADAFSLSDEDRTALYTAALLHDITKSKTDEEQLALCEKYGICLPADRQSVLSTLHQYTGAFVAEHTFGVDDEEVLDAIRYHTSGRPNMSELEKLIFLSDMLEPGRDFPKIAKLRKVFAEDLNECMYLCLKHELKYLKKGGGEIYPLTFRAYEYYKGLRS